MSEARQRIRVLSRWVVRGLGGALALLAALVLYGIYLALTDRAEIAAILNRAYVPPEPVIVTVPQVMLLLIVFLLQAGLVASALWALIKAFDAIASGEAIPSAAGRWTRRAGLAFLAAAVAMIIAHPLNSLIASLGAAPGHGFIVVAFSTGELLALVVSGVLVVFGHLIAVAAAVDAENREIV